jgi:hypothetical protein
MSITDCLALVLAGKQPDQNVPANLSNHPVTIPEPVTTTNNLNEPAANESPSNPDQLVLEQRDAF